MAQPSPPRCLYHSTGGRNLIEHAVNVLTKEGLFTPANRLFLRKATCTCNPSLAREHLLPLKDLAPSGVKVITSALDRADTPIAFLVRRLQPIEGKDSPEIAQAKNRLLAVVYRFIFPKFGAGAADAAADVIPELRRAVPFGFTPAFMAAEAERLKETQQGKKGTSFQLEVVSERVLDIPQRYVGRLIRYIRTLGMPDHIMVHLEDDNERAKQADRRKKQANKKGANRGGVAMEVDDEQEGGVVKVVIRGKLKPEFLGHKGGEVKKESGRRDEDDVDEEVDHSSEARPHRQGKARKQKAKAREQEQEKKEEEERLAAESEKELAKLKEAADVLLTVLIQKAEMLTLEEKQPKQQQRKKGGRKRPKIR